MNKALVSIILGTLITLGAQQDRKEDRVMTPKESEHAITALRAAYAAFNRGDIDAAVQFLDSHVEWTEPAEFPGGGTYHGIDGAKQYLTHSRSSVAQMISEPERFILAGDQIVVFVDARVLPKDSDTWQDVRLADVFTFQNGRVIQMHGFADRQEALHWAGLGRQPN